MPTPEHTLDDELVTDRRIAEELQDRLRRELQTAAAIRAYLLRSREDRKVVRSAARLRD